LVQRECLRQQAWKSLSISRQGGKSALSCKRDGGVMNENFKILGRKLKNSFLPDFYTFNQGTFVAKVTFAEAAYNLNCVPKWEYKLTLCE
jgi:hypothetical protein